MKAKGKMFWDDGEKIDSFQNGFYQINTFEFNVVLLQNFSTLLLINFSFFLHLFESFQNALSIQVTKGPGWTGINQDLDLIQILGWPSAPSAISVNGTVLPSSNYSYNGTYQFLSINYALDMNTNWSINFQ